MDFINWLKKLFSIFSIYDNRNIEIKTEDAPEESQNISGGKLIFKTGKCTGTGYGTIEFYTTSGSGDMPYDVTEPKLVLYIGQYGELIATNNYKSIITDENQLICKSWVEENFIKKERND